MATVTDPVCGMTVHPDTAEFRAENAGTTYYFCSNDCKEEFEADPSDYAV